MTENDSTLPLRTANEIVDYYEEHRAGDTLGFLGEVLINQLPFESAKPYLVEAATAEKWGEPASREALTAEAGGYMEFAWEKCLGHRGISAGRSVQKMQAYMFLLGEEELEKLTRDGSLYQQYGAPILWKICKVMLWPIPDEEDMQGPAHRMSIGIPCEPGCDMGCA